MTWNSAPSNFLLAGITVSVALLLVPSLSITLQIVVLGIAVALLGLPHGAIDAYIARQNGLWRSTRGFAAFVGIYAVVAIGVIGVWMIMPTPSLLAFLIISAWHFGADANARNQAERWLFGSLLLSLPSFFHPADVASLFEAISGASAGSLVSILQVWAPVAAIGVFAMLVRRRPPAQQRWADIATVAGLVLFAWALPPLVYFVIYFSALHSPAHFGRVIRLVPPPDRSSAIAYTVGFTALTLLIAGMAFIALTDEVTLQQSTLQIVFIGLAALTVPHMFLIDGICRARFGEAE